MLIDYTTEFQKNIDAECILAQGKNKQFIAICKLPEKTQRFDNKYVKYELIFKDLSEKCTDNNNAFVCVTYQESGLWALHEFSHKVQKYIKSKKRYNININIFDEFQLL